jgi:hypothetical protein
MGSNHSVANGRAHSGHALSGAKLRASIGGYGCDWRHRAGQNCHDQNELILHILVNSLLSGSIALFGRIADYAAPQNSMGCDHF